MAIAWSVTFVSRTNWLLGSVTSVAMIIPFTVSNGFITIGSSNPIGILQRLITSHLAGIETTPSVEPSQVLTSTKLLQTLYLLEEKWLLYYN